MKHFILLATIGIFSLTLASCTFYRVNADEIAFESFHPKKDHREIQYLETVDVPYEVVGTVVVSTERRNSKEEVIEKMKLQVSILGGDAITNIVQIDEPSAITRIRTKYKGTVIIFKKTPEAQQSEAVPVLEPQNLGENLK